MCIFSKQFANFLMINILLMGSSGTLCQEITPDDLKLLNNFEFSQLRDFVRGKGSVSKLALQDILSENFEEPDLAPTPPSDDDGQMVMIMPPQNFFQTSIMEPSRPRFAQTPKKQQPTISSTERYKEEDKNGPNQEDFEELARLLKLFRKAKPPKPQPPPPHQRERIHSQRNYKTANLPQPLPPSTYRRITTIRPNTKLLSPQPQPPTPLPPPPTRNLWSTYPKIRQESSPGFYRPKEDDYQKEQFQQSPKQGLPIVIEQEEPEFASFVISPPAENVNSESSWQGSVKPLAKSSAILPPSAREGEEFRSVWPKNEKIGDKKGPGQILKNINFKYREDNQLVEMRATSTAASENEEMAQPQGMIEPFNNINDWEEQMRELSRKLGSYLISIKKKKEESGQLEKSGYTVSARNFDLVKSKILHHESLYTTSPSTTPTTTTTTTTKPPKSYVTILREGYVQENPNDYDFIASITLVRDEEKVILVDTGLGTDINGRTDLIQKLQKLNIAPPMVDYVVVTHGHPDHNGNAHEFPDAVHFQSNFVHHRTKFNFSSLYQNKPHILTTNVFLLKTPGHTSDDITVMVHNTDRYGTIAITGDVFINVDDLDFPVTWQTLSWNETLQSKSRNNILCQADYIIPGHGKIFRVTNNMRGRVNCK